MKLQDIYRTLNPISGKIHNYIPAHGASTTYKPESKFQQI